MTRFTSKRCWMAARSKAALLSAPPGWASRSWKIWWSGTFPVRWWMAPSGCFTWRPFPETAARAQKDLEAKGVRVACDQMLDHIEQEADGRLTAVMQNGNRFTADTVAVCIGVRMNTGFLRDSGHRHEPGRPGGSAHADHLSRYLRCRGLL